ncbi:MAG: uroporphyrinogen-III decarboxylase-like protein [Phycisphaeraceae bacterium]|nr:uroporphyrinogen-III decarboxylase-like protein [Phycisphaeraceae bacterium]
MAMTPRERWIALLEGRTPDRVPTDYWATPDFHERFRRDLGCDDDEQLWRLLHIDHPKTVAPRWRLEHHPDDPQADMWGVRRRTIPHGTGTYDEVCQGPLANVQCARDVERFRWPDPDDFDYGTVRDTLATDDGERAIRAAVYEPFLIYCAMRGMEQAFEDLLLNPTIAEAILDHLFAFHYEHNRRVFEAGGGKIDLTYVAEDLGGQSGPLFGVELYRRFLLRNQKRMADLARSFRVHVFYHTDGAARDFIPLLVDEVGIEVLNPVQWRCPGMERESLVRDFGGRIAFHGAMDNQQTLPFGTVDDVAREVEENVAIFRDARWICAPCHNIQSVSSTENIRTLYEKIHDLGGGSS